MSSGGSGIGDAIPENGHRQTGVVRLMRDEGRERIQFNFHWQCAVVKIDMR